MEQPNLQDLVERLRLQLPSLKAEYRVQELGIFGSYVRGEENAASDLDMLVTFDETPSLLRFIELEHELTDLLGIDVDLVMRDALKSRIGEHILAEVQPV